MSKHFRAIRILKAILRLGLLQEESGTSERLTRPDSENFFDWKLKTSKFHEKSDRIVSRAIVFLVSLR